MAHIPVFHPQYDKIVRHVHHEHVSVLIREGLARPLESGLRGVRLTVAGIAHPCRTRISAGGPLAALGMSQVYTTRDGRGTVDGFKRIFPEDRHIFHAATLDCMAAASVT